MKEFYPYTIIPQKVEKIRQEGIPMPKLPKLLPMPDKPRRKILGTLLFIVSAIVFTALAIGSTSLLYVTIGTFFLALISLVAMIFEFVQFGKLKTQFEKDFKHYQERKEAYKKIKAKQDKIETENKNEEIVKKHQQESINEFFSTSYDTINAVHNEYSPAKKRFKLFLEEYFPDEVLDNIKVVHRTKKINYVPDYVIQFEKPKLNVAIEIEEPYTLSNVPENIQKDYEAKDRLRQRFANELGWIVIVLSEEQAVKSPTECCKFIEDSIETLFSNIKNGDQFVNIKPIKKQKMLTGEERAHLKKSKYREKYLIEAGLLDGPVGYSRKKEEEEKLQKKKSELEYEAKLKEKESKPEEKAKLKEEESEINEETTKIENKEIEELNSTSKEMTQENETKTPELSETMETKKTPLEKKKEIENEQMQLIKKIAQRVKNVSNGEESPEKEQEPIKHYTEENISKTKKETAETDNNEEKPEKIKQTRKEEDILKDLQKALDSHSLKRKEKEDEKKIEKATDEIKKVPVAKVERKIKSAAEIILERKQQLEKEQKEKGKQESEKEEVTPETIEHKTEEVKEPVVEEKKEESFIEEDIKQEEKAEEVKIEKEETHKEKEIATVANKTEKKEIGKEAAKNQEIIDSYREKIEGAVFDKQWDELIELCDEAIKEVPYWDWAYYRRSTAWGHKKEFPKVILDCNKAIGFNPTLADAYYNRGTARFFLGKFMEACEDYQKSIDLNYIKKADAYFNRGLCFQKLDQKKKAYREFLKAKEMGSQKAIEIIKNYYTE
jgi:hypothetical protein